MNTDVQESVTPPDKENRKTQDADYQTTNLRSMMGNLFLVRSDSWVTGKEKEMTIKTST